MSELISSMDLIEQVKAKRAGKAVSTAPKAQRVNALKAIEDIKDHQAREMMHNLIMKEVQSPDIAQLRLVSLAPRASELRNEMTILLNIAEANPVVRLTDFQVRFREIRVGTDTSPFFNPNGTLPAEATSLRPMRTNTLGFIGNQLKIRFIAQELGNQSPVESVDVRAEEIDFEITRIRRGMNSALISNVEQTSEAAANIPQPGGFLTRSTLYNLNAGGVDITNALLQGRLDAIANVTSPEGYGYESMVALTGSNGQIAKVRDLMIARYPGENSSAYQQTSSAMRLAAVNVPVEQMVGYRPLPGKDLLVGYEPQMASGTMLFFDPIQLQLGKFQMMNSLGPWVLERPTSDLLYLLLCFDSFSVVDRLIPSRAVLTGLNA